MPALCDLVSKGGFLMVFGYLCHLGNSRFLTVTEGQNLFACAALCPLEGILSVQAIEIFEEVGNACALYCLDEQYKVWKLQSKAFPSRGGETLPLPFRLYSCVFREEDSQWKEEQKLEAHSDWVRDVAWAPSIGLPTSTIASCSQVRVLRSDRGRHLVRSLSCASFPVSLVKEL